MISIVRRLRAPSLAILAAWAASGGCMDSDHADYCYDQSLFYNPATDNCVECLGDEDCYHKAGAVCVPAGFCGCRHDVDCVWNGAGSVCMPDSHCSGG